jgi:glutathione transport system permease protein
VTAAIALMALAVSVPIGLVAGLAMAAWPRSAGARLLFAAAVAGMSAPPVVVSLALSGLMGIPPGWGGLSHALAPVLALGIAGAVPIAVTSRTLLSSGLAMDHCRTARAKGLTPWLVAARHGLSGVRGPVIGHCGAVASVLLTATATVEIACGVPGLAGIAVQAVLARDAAVASAAALILAAGISIVAIGTDIIQSWADPRPSHVLR